MQISLPRKHYTLLIIAERLGYISQTTLEGMEHELSEIARPLSGLILNLMGK